MSDRIVIRAEHKSEPNLRKLARALIALARRQVEEQQRASALEQSDGPKGTGASS